MYVHAQDLAGFRTSNYAGVNSVYFNPANIANSPYRFDVNILGINAGVGNNQIKFKLNDAGNTFNGDTIKNQLFGQSKGLTKALVNLSVFTPSVMFNVAKFSFAVTTRVRSTVNVTNLDGKLADRVVNDLSDNTNLPYTIASNDNMGIAVNVWAEYGGTVAREILAVGPHHLRAGITLKYLAGAGNGSINIDKLHATMNVDEGKQDAYLTNAKGAIGMNFSGFNVSDFNGTELAEFKGHGFGADLGLVYEYRPGTSGKYKYRFGLSLVDAGKIKYERDVTRSGTFAINIPAGQQFSLKNLDGVDLDNYKSTLSGYPQYFTPVDDKSSYSVSMPTSLRVDGDYHILNGLYVNLDAQLALTNGKNKAYNVQYFSGFSVTPRYENRIFSAFLPISYNELTKFTAGASFRVGPFFIGSGSILSALMGSSHQLDGFIGFHAGGLKKHK
ncbi:hypothetical protein DVR12_04950 [Chitinophaga silvatica]|uniref:DUF5723 domain-containing protein n=2 Tax=Chitinophaga silvatica TaxID=2282649 RepID=A0A3E1YDD0_9BACT|nr:hypothetical protein DVR12_04950 [Chitinophaga silvatica]